MLKLLVVDCDGTLWTGIAGEHAVRKRILVVQSVLELAEAGVLVVACTRNTQLDIDPLLDVIGLRAHLLDVEYECRDKAAYIHELSKRTRIAVSDMVFADDDPVERGLVSALTDCVVIGPWGIPYLQAPDTHVPNRLEKTRTALEIWDGLKTGRDEYLRGLDQRVWVLAPTPQDEHRISELYRRVHKLKTGGEPDGLLWAIFMESRLEEPELVGGATVRNGDLTSMVMSCRMDGRGVWEEAIRQLGVGT